ncbi:MAG: hypothetical protein HQL51_02785 [Magnetococcales bacterium]|nr:hypothetical protein [Magnetococcales bacterium]
MTRNPGPSSDDSPPSAPAPTPWHLRPAVIWMAILLTGPLAIPLVWRSPAFTRMARIAIILGVGVITVLLLGIIPQYAQDAKELLIGAGAPLSLMRPF